MRYKDYLNMLHDSNWYHIIQPIHSLKNSRDYWTKEFLNISSDGNSLASVNCGEGVADGTDDNRFSCFSSNSFSYINKVRVFEIID